MGKEKPVKKARDWRLVRMYLEAGGIVMTQCDRLEAFLNERGSITPIESWSLLGIYRLSARIYQLKHEQGMNIETERAEVENRWGEKCCVARYRLVEPQMELLV